MFPSLPSLGSGFESTGAGLPKIGQSGGGLDTGWQIPGTSPSSPSVLLGTNPSALGNTGIVSNVSSGLLGLFGGSLLRIVLLIIGLLCIAGAIYLYKPTSELIAAPARAARDAAVVGATAA